MKVRSQFRRLRPIRNRTQLPPDHRDKYLDYLETSYLFSIFELFALVRDKPGHVVELGVGAGRNAILFGNLLKMTGQSSNSRYFGFDTFSNYPDRDLQRNPHLDSTKWKGNSLGFVELRLSRHGLSGICELVEGDVQETLNVFLDEEHPRYSPGAFYCRLVYVDTSTYSAARIGMHTLFDRLVPGGVLAIDQRRQGDEWIAFMEFCTDRGLEPNCGVSDNGVVAFVVR